MDFSRTPVNKISNIIDLVSEKKYTNRDENDLAEVKKGIVLLPTELEMKIKKLLPLKFLVFHLGQ